MKRLVIALGLLSSFASVRAFAGVTISVGVNFPAPPPLVVVSPGVQVVEDYDEEVFVTGGYYWVERDGVWYRSPDYRGHWVVVERTRVPVFLVKHHPGEYRHWKHEEHEEHEIRHEEHEEAKAEKHEMKAQKHHGKH